ncbi:MAG: cytochrome b/b6 domain-containing protein [Bacteroidales bacterium]|nr:cytochrome b/b6 domain-containing protein [Bacteroidales bacterium]
MLNFKKLIAVTICFFYYSVIILAQSNDDCLMCHEDKDLTAERYGKTVSMYVNKALLQKSAHSKVECVSCHKDAAGSEFPHSEKLKKVSCGSCHTDYSEQVNNDIHNTLMKKTCKNPPTCKDCHNTHNVKKPANVKNKSKQFCGKCHETKVLSSAYHISSGINKGCVECHNETDYKLMLEKSVHANLECANCHGHVVNNLKGHETDNERPSADCYLCHGSIASEHKESIHGISIKEGMFEAANCWNCHGSHEITKVASENSKVSSRNLIKTCGECHDDDSFSEKHHSSVKHPAKLYSTSVHAKLVEMGRMDAAGCTSCHGVHNIKNRIQPGSTISSIGVSKSCGKCHEEIQKEYEQSIHWMSVKKGVGESPTCNDCHSEHCIKEINNLHKKEEIKKLQEQTCLECHQNLLLSERFGIDEESAANYQDSYHGLATMRGDDDAAMCIDCHGVHKILPKYHEESTIHEGNVVETCRKCHEGASDVFSKSYSHSSEEDSSAKFIEDIVETIYFWLIIIVIGGMAVHNLIIFIYDLREKRKEINKAIRIPRFTRNELIQHIILLLSFSILAITGFQLKYPDSWWAEGLSYFGLNEVARQWTHRISALVMIGLSIWHVVYLGITARGRDVLRGMLLKVSDIKHAIQNISYHLHLRKKHPEFDNYNYIEKAEYWALIWGTIVMAVTGFILWFPTVIGDWAPLWVIKVSEIVHFYEAILATLAIIVWHWFFVMFRPQEYPMSFTCVDGKMTIIHFKDEHKLKYKKVMLEWVELKEGKRTEKQLSHFGNLFIKAVEKSGANTDEFIKTEIDNDEDLRIYIEENKQK